MSVGKRKLTSRFVAIAALVLVIVLGIAEYRFSFGETSNYIRFYSMPPSFLNKADGITLNIHGKLNEFVSIEHYRINNRQRIQSRTGSPRLNENEFVIEFLAEDLNAGENILNVTIVNLLGSKRQVELVFNYDSTPPKLPVLINWTNTSLESQDGQWEKVKKGGQVLVRPVPGTEGYDRILLASGAFKGSRRVESIVTFVKGAKSNKLFGFGIIPLWGGHADSTRNSPRRGWKYGLGWYYSKEKGIGVEFSDKVDDEKHITLSKYTKFKPIPGKRYKIVIDSKQILSARGEHLTYFQTMTWTRLDSNQPPISVELYDKRNEPFGDFQYSVALLAHRAQVEFNSVTISVLEPIIVGAEKASSSHNILVKEVN